MTTQSSTEPAIPDFAQLAADLEIAPLLEFDPAPRKVDRPDGWTAERQRELIARIAFTGSPGEACDAMDKNLSGAKHLYRSDGAESFRQAWKAAIAVGASRKRAERAALPPRPFEVPGITRRGKGSLLAASALTGQPGQVRMHNGEWVDPAALAQLAEEARDRITQRLLRARRLYLHEIADSPGKRAAFEMLTRLPIDWDKARRLEPQADEPWKIPNMRNPDMLLTAENGWMGDAVHGEDKMAELRAAMDAWRAKKGLEPVDWNLEPPSAGE